MAVNCRKVYREILHFCCSIVDFFLTLFELLRDALLTWCVPYEAIIAPFATLGAIGYIIYTDDFMYRHKMKFLMAQLCFWAFGFILVLGKACELKRKPYTMKKREEDLYDIDFQHIENLSYYSLRTFNPWTFLKNLIKNYYEFNVSRPAYGMYFLTAFLCVAAMIFFYNSAETLDNEDPYREAGAILISPTIMLFTFVFFLTNTGWYVEPEHQGYYEPFDESVPIPMKVLVRKAVAMFISAGITHAVLSLFVTLLILLCIASADIIWTSSYNQVLETIFLGFSHEPQAVVLSVLAASVLSCAIVLIGMIISTFVEVKKSIMGTIEKNFERNMIAIRFLLRDTEADNLTYLQYALDCKMRKALTREITLSEDERKAFLYIHNPIWMSKQPFGGIWRKPDKDDDSTQRPDEDDSTQRPDEDDSTQRPDEDLPPKEQPVLKDPVLVEQEDKGYVEEADTESAEDENDALQQESEEGKEGSQQEYEGYRLRQRKSKVAEPSTLEGTPAGTVKSRRSKL